MKTKTIAIIGGGALVAYFLYTKSKATPVKPVVNPNLVLANSQAAQNAALISTGTSLFNTAVNAIQNADNQSAPVYSYSAPPSYTNTPTPDYSSNDSSVNNATDNYSQDNGGSTYDATMSGMRRKGINRNHIV